MEKLKVVTIYRSLMATERLAIVDVNGKAIGFCCLGRDGLACGLKPDAMAKDTFPANYLLTGWADVWMKSPTETLLSSIPAWADDVILGDIAIKLNDCWQERGLTAEEFIALLRPVFREAGRIIRYYPNR